MKLFELFATLGLDTADFDTKLDGAYQTLVDVSQRAEEACAWTLRLFDMPSATAAAQRIQRWWEGVSASVQLTLPSPVLGSVFAGNGTGSVPGFATGLDYVPYNGFPAVLHEGEAVLTKAQASAWRGGEAAVDLTGLGDIVGQAVRGALEGVAVTIDGQAAGQLLAGPVSRGIADMAQAGRFAQERW